QGAGEPPTPGTSKMIASGPCRASRKGSNNSILAPIPLKRSRGGCALSPGLTPTRNVRPSTSCRLICIYFSVTYRPGAAPSGGFFSLPSISGADVSSPERALTHASQCGHQLPLNFADCSSHASAFAGRAAAAQKRALGLPGGLSRLWIWPLLASTKVLRSPKSFAVL